MQLIANSGSKRVWLGRSQRPYTFESPVAGEYALLLVIADEDISVDEQWDLSERFVRTGCRSASCFGKTSSLWDDSIDMVGVMDEVENRPTQFVLTSWHDDEPLAEAVDFFADHSHFEGWSTDEYVVFLVGGSEQLEDEVRAAVCRRFAQLR